VFTKTQTEQKTGAFEMNQSITKNSKEQGQVQLDIGIGKMIEARFDGGKVSSDGGLLLLRKSDEKLELSEMASLCIRESRRPDLVKHDLVELIRQRIYGIAAGYEDCNDVGRIGGDAMHQLASGKLPSEGRRLASQPTLSRFENAVDETSLAALQKLLIHTYIRWQGKRPRVVRLSMDTTHDEVHGYQQLSFYNGFYKTYCYTPLFVFAEPGFPVAALLRPGNASTYDGAVRMLREVVHNLRLAWPGVRIELTADAGFGVPEVYEFCEQNGVTYWIGMKGNNALDSKTETFVQRCSAKFAEFGLDPGKLKKYGKLENKRQAQQAWRKREERIRYASKAEGRMQEHFEDELAVRDYLQVRYEARGWSCERRVIARCEYTSRGPDLRYVVTNAQGSSARKLYENKYCCRARCENWIKDLKNYLDSDRTSCQEFKANQFRVLLHTFAYILLFDIRESAGVKAATIETIRLRLIKIGVVVRETAQRVCLHLASECIWKPEFEKAWHSL
jgi:hypothetical protein